MKLNEVVVIVEYFEKAPVNRKPFTKKKKNLRI